MSLSAWYRQVFYAETLGYPRPAGVAIGLGITVGGKLGGFIYDANRNRIAQAVWPRTVSVDVPHCAGVIVDGSNIILYLDGDHYARNAANTGWENVYGHESFHLSTGNRAAVGGAWFGYNSPHNTANAHKVELGRFAVWQRALSRNTMWLINQAGGEWRCYEIQRINKVLDFAGWPAAWRAGLTWPHSTTQLLGPTKWDDGANATDLIQRAAGSVRGLVFVAADGKLTYQTPGQRDQLGEPVMTFTDSAGTAIDDTFAYSIDDNDIVNTVTAVTPNGVSLEWADAASVATYGERQQTVDTDLLYPADVIATAQSLIARYKQPILRCPSITVDASATPDDTQAVFDLELGAVIGLADLPATAPAAQMTAVIESIAWKIDADSRDWKVTFEVSPGQLIPPDPPGAPTDVTAEAGDTTASVSFTAPADDGGASIDDYRVTASRDGATASGPGAPLLVDGLSNNFACTFTARAHNTAGWGPASVASNTVIPISPSLGSYTDEVLADSPLFYLRLDDTLGTTAVDSTTNGHDGTYAGSTYTLGADPLFAGSTASVAFDHSGGVTVDDVTTATDSDTFSIEAWVQAPSGQGGGNILSQVSNLGGEWSADDGFFSFGVDGGSVALTLSWDDVDNPGSWLYNDRNLYDNAAHHVVVTVDLAAGESGLKIYIDGVADTTYFSGPSIRTRRAVTTSHPIVGNTAGTWYYPTSISDVAYYTTELSAARVAAHYAARTN